MKNKKTMLLTGVLCAAVGLVGCSNNIKDNDKADTTDTSISSKKDIAEEVDYIKKSGLKFEKYNYTDDFSGLEINYDRSEQDEYKEKIEIKLPIVNRGDDVFKEQLKIATKAVGGTDEEYKKIIDKIAECLTEEYQKTNEVAEEISSTGNIKIDMIKNPKYKVKIALYNVEEYNGIMRVSFLSKNKTNYVEDSNLPFQEANYFDKKTKLKIEQVFLGSHLDIYLEVPVKNVTNSKFKEQIEIAVKSIGGSDKDLEQIYSRLNGSYSNDFYDFIEDNDLYGIIISFDKEEGYINLNLRAGFVEP